MTTYAFRALPVVDPDGAGPGQSSLVPSADFQFFAYSDTTYSTPLTVTSRVAGVPTTTTTLTTSRESVLEEFSVEDQWRVWAKSGDHVVLLESTQGLADAAEASRLAAVAAQLAAETAAADAATATSVSTVQINTHLGGDAAGLIPNVINEKADLDPVTGYVVASQIPPSSGGGLNLTELESYLGGDGTNLVGTVNGKADDTAVVHKSGDETLAGIKTFTSPIAVPNGTFSLAKLTNFGAAANRVVVHNGTSLEYRFPDEAMLAAGSEVPIFQNSDFSWPANPSARLDLRYKYYLRPGRTDIPSYVVGALMNTLVYRAS